MKSEEEKYSMGKFRGTWNATNNKPSFNAFAFLPTAPPIKPRVKDVVVQTYVVSELPLLNEAPIDAEILVNIKDRLNNFRGFIAKDGSCYNNQGTCIGYINDETNEAGSSDQEYLGCLRQLGNQCQIEDSLDEVAGTLDMGLATLIDSSGRTVAELSNSGTCMGHSGTYLGEFEGFKYKNMKTIALYLVLIDPGMLDEISG